MMGCAEAFCHLDLRLRLSDSSTLFGATVSRLMGSFRAALIRSMFCSVVSLSRNNCSVVKCRPVKTGVGGKTSCPALRPVPAELELLLLVCFLWEERAFFAGGGTVAALAWAVPAELDW